MKRLTGYVPSFVRADAGLRRILRALGSGLLLAMALPRTHAAGPPEAMTYQGFLVDANGNPLATNNPANYPVIFRIFAAASGGASLWSEQQIVTVDKGNFSVILSEGTAVGGEPKPLLSAVMGTNGVDRFIQISVTINGSSLDLLPRLRLLPSPYAFLATSASQLVNPSGAAMVLYANSRVEVNGSFNASGTISGNGGGLTGLTPTQIPALDASKIASGTLADTLLSPNVALLADNNAFIGNQTMSGNLGIGTPNTTFPLTIGNQSTGDKISLWGQSGNSFGFGVGPNLLQIHGNDASSDIAFGYGSSAAMTELMRIKGNGNVGIGTNNPTGQLTVNGGVLARGGAPGANGVNDNGFAFTGNGGDNDSGMFSSAAGQLEFYANAVERFRMAGANIGIGTTNPTATLDVNGTIKGSTVNATNIIATNINAGTIVATNINGEKPPYTFEVGTTANTVNWTAVDVPASIIQSYLGDANGGTVQLFIRENSTDNVFASSQQFYMEQPIKSRNVAAGISGTAVSNRDTAVNWILNNGSTSDLVSAAGNIYVRNYITRNLPGLPTGAETAFSGVDAYKFQFLTPPNYSATVVIYDR